MSKPSRKKTPAGIVVLGPDDKAPAELARWSAPGPGYHPGAAVKHKGKVYVTPDFPLAVAVAML